MMSKDFFLMITVPKLYLLFISTLSRVILKMPEPAREPLESPVSTPR